MGVGVRVGISVGVGVGDITINVITDCEGPYAVSPNQSIFSVWVPSDSFAVSAAASDKLPEDAEHVPAGLMFHVPPAA